MKFGAIDIGSNAVRLIFINVIQTENGPVFIKDAMYRVALRLGEESFQYGFFTKKKMQQIVTTMQAYQHLINVHQPVSIMACATSAMRDASNNKEVVALVKAKTGINIEVISGQKEASLVLHNHVEKFGLNENKNYLYIDVGGGSTELVLISRGKTITKKSFNIGTIRLNVEDVKTKDWNNLQNWLKSIKKEYNKIKGIGVGGNINAVLNTFTNAIEKKVSYETVKSSYKTLSKMSQEEKMATYNFKPDRADVIVPALQIFKFIMKELNIKNLIVPKVGLGDGMVHLLYDDYKKNRKHNK
ncbi:MAG: exopolyphosphatase [Chitinophagales bacterium]|nr:exopolyphosphatase [Chitinophagales bacterium]